MIDRLRALVADIVAPRRPPIVPPAPTQAPPPEFAVERHNVCLADLTRDEVRELITSYNARAEAIGCLVLNDGKPTDRVLIIFAGDQERFHMLAAARNVRCPVIYVQDFKSPWYCGSDLLPDLQSFCRHFLVEEVSSAPALLFGQSSGAYAALVASTYLIGSTVVACSPQTFSDASAKSKIHFVGVRPLSTPPDIVDVRERLETASDATASKAIVIAVSELGNPVTAHFWMDYMHALRVADLPDIHLFIVNSDSHAIVHGRVNVFADLLEQLASELSASVNRRNELVLAFLNRTFER